MKTEYTPRQLSLLQQYDNILKLHHEVTLTELDKDYKMYGAIRYNFGNLSNFKDAYFDWKDDESEIFEERYNDFENPVEEDDKFYTETQKIIQKYKNTIKDLRRSNNLLMNQIVTQENMYDYITQHIPFINYNHINKNIDVRLEECKKGTAILHLSDLHYGEVVQFGDVIYDCAIAESRLSSIISQFCYIVNGYKKAVVFINGDMINGTIHDEFRATNELVTIDAILRLSKVLSESLILIREYMDKDGLLDVVFTVGNHSRTIPGPVYYKNKVKENWEYLLGEMVKRELTDTDIKVEVCSTSAIVYDIEGLKFAITHGDCFKSLASLRIGVAKFQEMNMSSIGPFDHILLGHFHTTMIMDGLGGKIFANGSLKGIDEYSINKLYQLSKPEQTCLLVNDKKITNIIILNSEDE